MIRFWLPSPWGVLAVGIALHHPQKVKGLVLLATSGGVDLSQFGCADWRIDYREQFKDVPDWFYKIKPYLA